MFPVPVGKGPLKGGGEEGHNKNLGVKGVATRRKLPSDMQGVVR